MEYRIGNPERQCLVCGKEIAEGDAFYSAIFEGDESFTRRDYCAGCWADPPEACYSFWRTRIAPKKEDARKKIDADVVLGFFDQLEEKDSDLDLNFRYVLGLLLMRKRVLKFDDIAREASGEFLVLRRPGEQKRHHVRVRSLADEEIRELTEEVGRLLAANSLTEEGGEDEGT